jgi:hypothetical protein
MRRIRSHLTFANVMAMVAVFVVLGGGAIAAIDSNKRAKKSHPRWAVVSADGDLVRGKGVKSASRLFGDPVLGSYQVTFKRNIRRCGIVATIGRTNAADLDPDPGEIGVAYRNGKRKAAYVKTRGSDGAGANRSFHLAVFC